MRLRRIVIAAVAAASLVVAAGTFVSFLPTKSGHSVAQTVFGGSTPSATDASASRPSQSPVASAPATSAKDAKGEKKQDNSLISGVGHGGSEQIPTAKPTPYRLHPTAPPTMLSAADVSAAPHSTGATRSVSSSQGTTQVFVSATSSTPPAGTVAYYQRVFTALGMKGESVPAVGGSTAIAFSLGSNSVTLTVSPHGKGSRYLIHGVLRTGA